MTGYPKNMVHPHARKGTYRELPGTGRINAEGREIGRAIQGTPDLFPPVWVNNPDEEAAHRAKGYLELGEKAPPPVAFAEYPVMLVHPDHVPGVPDTRDARRKDDGSIETYVIKGTPEQFPAVQVHTPEEERAWEAKGYGRPGTFDPKAIEAEHAAPGVRDYRPTEYPKVVEGKVVESPDLPPPGPAEYPKWLNIPSHQWGGIEVKDRAAEIEARAKHGLEPMVAPTIKAAEITPATLSGTQANTVPPLTRGQKAAATRAAKKAAAAQQPAA